MRFLLLWSKRRRRVDTRRFLRKAIPFALAIHLLLSGWMANHLEHQRMLHRFLQVVEKYGEVVDGDQAILEIPRIRRTEFESTALSRTGQVLRGNATTQNRHFFVDHVHSAMVQAIQRTVSKLEHIEPCRWTYESRTYVSGLLDCEDTLLSPPRPSRGEIFLFNPLDQERILCDGSRIPPASLLAVATEDFERRNCTTPPRLFAVVPSLQTKDALDPINVSFRSSIHAGASGVEEQDCNIPCVSNLPQTVTSKRFVTTTPFQIEFSMEGPQYYPQLRIDRSTDQTKFYSTTSFSSEVPLPYFSWEEWGNRIRPTTAVKYNTAIHGAVFIAKNCRSKNEREKLVKALIASPHIRVDSVSQCLHNAEAIGGTDDKQAIMRQYLFYLAFENQCEPDYITEKLWGALESGTVGTFALLLVLPSRWLLTFCFVCCLVAVYYGAPNALDHVPPNSIIHANAFDTPEDLAEYLGKVATNRTLYESYQAWRTKPLPETFLRKYNFTHAHSTCRTCRWAFAKKYGLGWDHVEQTVLELEIPRKTCHDGLGVLTHPFRESWLLGTTREVVLEPSSISAAEEACLNDQAPSQLVTNLSGSTRSLRRTIDNHDGVLDIRLERLDALSEDDDALMVLRLDTPIKCEGQFSGCLISYSKQYHQFQDATKRMTILTSSDSSVRMTDMGTAELELPTIGAIFHIRVIVENVDTFYDDGANRTNYFASMMTEEFLNPLQAFVAWGDDLGSETRWTSRALKDVGIIAGPLTKVLSDPQIQTDVK